MTIRIWIFGLLAFWLSVCSSVTDSYSVQVILVLLAIGFASWSVHLVDIRRRQGRCSRVSGSNILALFVIMGGVVTVIHGPIGPEMLETRVRAQVAGEKIKLREIAIALEAYRVETGLYPFALTPYLTTPIGYFPAVPMDGCSEEPAPYFYWQTQGDWFLVGVGPDHHFSSVWNKEALPEPEGVPLMWYDSSNGIVSEGDIIMTRAGFLQEHER